MKVDILSPVKYNGKDLAVGAKNVEIDRDDVGPLIEAGAVVPHDAKAAAAAKAEAAKVASLEQAGDPVAAEKAAAAALADATQKAAGAALVDEQTKE